MEQNIHELGQLMKLPAGYEWAHTPSVKAHEIMKLRQSAGWDAGIEAIWLGCIDTALSLRAVRLIATGELVGVGFLTGNGRHAALCDFCVHAQHQGKGIGLAILHARIADAERMRIPYLYASISAKNRLKNVYEDYGFESTGANLFRARTSFESFDD
jgi:GNAT superfamily N-acetyltransferase